MPTKQQLESALFNADAAGDFDAAKQLANAIKGMATRTPEQTEQLRTERLDKVPEIGSGTGLLSGESSGKIAAMAALIPVTPNPDEIAKMLESQFPGVIGISHTPEGRLIARNNKSGAVAELNKPGLSQLDVFQFLGIGSAFFPSGAGVLGSGAKALGKLAVKSGATQTAIEAAQAGGGGEFNPGQIALETAAAPIAQLGVEKLIKPAAKKLVGEGVKAAKRTAQTATDKASQLRSFFEQGDQPLEDAVKISTTGAAGDVVEMIRPDIDFYRAAEELGISSEPLASFASQNPQFRDIEQALASIPGNTLDPQGKAFISELSTKADNLITEYGGSLDKGGVSESFRQTAMDTIKGLEVKADDVYSALDSVIPKTTPVRATNTLDFIKQKAVELGGTEKLSPKMKSLLNDLSSSQAKTKKGFSHATGTTVTPGKVTLPTHELLSQRRREVGQAIGKRSGSFRKEETGILKALYGRLASDQDAAASGIGGEALSISESAKGLIIQRKQLEDNLTNLIGKDLSKSITEIVGASVKGLPKGRLNQFNKRLAQIPEKQRSEVVLTALNDIFRGSGVDQQALNATQFSKFMDDLNRQPAAKKALYDALPPKSRKALNNIYKVSKGVSVALGQKIPTGRVLSLFEQENGLLKKVMGKGLAWGTAKAAGGGPSGMAAGAMVDEFLNQSTGKAKAASELLASPQFIDAIKVAVREGNIESGQISRQLAVAEKALAKSKAFKEWSEFIDNETLGRLMRGTGTGMTSYFLENKGKPNE